MKKTGKFKRIGLNRILFGSVLGAYIVIVTLLLVLDWFLIYNYRKENRNQRVEILTAAVEHIQQGMTDVNKKMYETWLYSEELKELSESTYNSGQFSNAMYDLISELKNAMATDENFHGYFIYYPSDEKCRYRTNENYFTAAETEELSRILYSYCKSGGADTTDSVSGQWIAVLTENNPVLAVAYEKEQVTLFGVYSLREDVSAVTETLGTDAEVILYCNGSWLCGAETGQKLRAEEHQWKTDLTSWQTQGWDIYGTRISNTELKILLAEKQTLWSYLNLGQLLLLLTELLSIVMLTMASVFIRREVVLPLRELVAVMNRIRTGEEYHANGKQYRVAELRDVNDTFGVMMEEIRLQKARAYEATIEKQKASMQYLLLQLRPHFYLNSLKVLNALCVSHEENKAQELILRISEHLRYLMSVEREIIPLERELAFCSNYVELQKRMTGRLIDYREEVPEQDKKIEVPMFCVETFLENSVRYARLSSTLRVLKLEVTAAMLETDDGLFLDLTVRDNGEGYPEDVMRIPENPQELRKTNGENDDGNQSGTHVGILNFCRRCRILYGEKAEISLYNDNGAVSEMVIPVGRR